MVGRIACSMGRSLSSTLADDGRSRPRSTPYHMEAHAWLSKSIRSTRRAGAARAALRLTAVVVFPTPPLLLATAMTTGNRAVILSQSTTEGRPPAKAGLTLGRAPVQ